MPWTLSHISHSLNSSSLCHCCTNVSSLNNDLDCHCRNTHPWSTCSLKCMLKSDLVTQLSYISLGKCYWDGRNQTICANICKWVQQEMHDEELCTPNLYKTCGNIIEALQQSSVAAFPNNLPTQLVMERASKVYRTLTTKGCSTTCSLCPVYMIRPAGIRVTLISH